MTLRFILIPSIPVFFRSQGIEVRCVHRPDRWLTAEVVENQSGQTPKLSLFVDGRSVSCRHLHAYDRKDCRQEAMSQRTTVDDERLRGRRCGIDNCPSKRYFKIDGRVVCDRGHEQVLLG